MATATALAHLSRSHPQNECGGGNGSGGRAARVRAGTRQPARALTRRAVSANAGLGRQSPPPGRGRSSSRPRWRRTECAHGPGALIRSSGAGASGSRSAGLDSPRDALTVPKIRAQAPSWVTARESAMCLCQPVRCGFPGLRGSLGAASVAGCVKPSRSRESLHSERPRRSTGTGRPGPGTTSTMQNRSRAAIRVRGAVTVAVTMIQHPSSEVLLLCLGIFSCCLLACQLLARCVPFLISNGCFEPSSVSFRICSSSVSIM